MNGINLIPVNRLAARRRAARVRMWISIAPLCVSLLAGSYGYFFATWETDAGGLTDSLEKTDAMITATQAQIAKARADLAEAQATLRANIAIGNQPDWGLLLELLARTLGESAVLSSCTVEHVAKPSTAEPPKQGPQAKAPAPGPADPLRAERFRLTLAGVARTQSAVPEFVQRLQNTGLFDSTKMIEAIRTPFAGEEAFKFQVECLISDNAVENP